MVAGDMPYPAIRTHAKADLHANTLLTPADD
jgi:hypothetical protein